MRLYNIYSKKKLKLHMLKKTEQRITLSFYKYFNICNPLKMRNIIYYKFNQLNIFGRIYIAREGINAQISILRENVERLRMFLHNIDDNLQNILINEALNQEKSFWVLTVKMRNQIVADGLSNHCFNTNHVGTYVEIPDVNIMIDKPNTIFVDMRNDYEYAIGHFKNAIHIPGTTFRQQLQNILGTLEKYKNKNIVMYCTGGIRCEKTTWWLKYNKYPYVYHIKGGILNYINESYKKNLKIEFQGSNFVFDNRMTEKISDHIFTKCKTCNTLCNRYINCKYDYCHLLFIQCSKCSKKYNSCCSYSCQNHF